jgi:hypothetical protein
MARNYSVHESKRHNSGARSIIWASVDFGASTAPLSIRNNKWVKWDYQFVGQYEFTPTLGANIS